MRTSEFIRGEGLRLFREDGSSVIDAASGTFNTPLGYNHPHVVRCCHEQLDCLSHLSSQFAKAPARHLVDRITPYAPQKITTGRVRDISGSTAVEGAIKMCQKASGNAEVIALQLSHHGQTVFATEVSGQALRKSKLPYSGANVLHVEAPYCHRCPFGQKRAPQCGFLCAERIDSTIELSSSGSVAAIIVEPCLGNGGNIVPPDGYFAVIADLCRKHNLFLIADEVQTGAGRTGYLLASEYFDIQADAIALAKGISGIGIPGAALILNSEELEVLEPHEHSSTSGGSPLALAAMHATLDVMLAEGFLQDVRKRGRYLEHRLTDLVKRFDVIGDLRGIGMMYGLEIEKSRGLEDGKAGERDVERTNAIVRRAFELGLIVRSSQYGFGNVVKVRPALIATYTEIDEIVDLLAEAIASTSK